MFLLLPTDEPGFLAKYREVPFISLPKQLDVCWLEKVQGSPPRIAVPHNSIAKAGGFGRKGRNCDAKTGLDWKEDDTSSLLAGD
jgi:hypothetical protein